jgi:uncharacterized SAM-dependent methyltransferase
VELVSYCGLFPNTEPARSRACEKRSRCRLHTVPVNGCRIHFAEGEAITTEYSYKYTISGFRNLAASAGYRPLRVWTDPDKLFSVHLMAFGPPV